MAILTTLNRISYTADGAQTTFAYPFKVYASTDLTVYDNGVLQTSGYTVTGVGIDTGGNVVFTLAPTATHTVLIVRIEPQTQATVLPTAGSFPAKSVETMSDKLTMLIQQLAEVDARALKLAISSAYKDLLVPDPVAGKFLQWKDTTALQNADVTATGSIGLPVVIAQGGTGSITPDAARLALGAGGWKQGADIASAATLPLANPLDGNLFNVTGSVGVTGIASAGLVAGTRIVLKFAGTPLLTTGASLKLRGAVNYQVVANDLFEFLYLGGGVWQEIERNFSTAGTISQFLRGDGVYAAPVPDSGCVLSNDAVSPATVLDISAGSRYSDEANPASRVGMVLASAFTKTTAAWAAGTGNGGLFAGASALANGATYHVFLIRKDADGSVDVGLDSSVTGANVPAGWSHKRWLGPVKCQAGSTSLWVFHQYLDEFWLDTPVLDVDRGVNPGTLALTDTLTSLPSGVKVQAILNAIAWNANIDNAGLYLSSLDAADVAASFTGAPLLSVGVQVLSFNAETACQVRVWTNTAKQIRARMSASGASDRYYLATLGCRVNLGL